MANSALFILPIGPFSSAQSPHSNWPSTFSKNPSYTRERRDPWSQSTALISFSDRCGSVPFLSLLSWRLSGSRRSRSLALLAARIAPAVSGDLARKPLRAYFQVCRIRAGVLGDAFDWMLVVRMVPRMHPDERAPSPYRFHEQESGGHQFWWEVGGAVTGILVGMVAVLIWWVETSRLVDLLGMLVGCRGISDDKL